MGRAATQPPTFDRRHLSVQTGGDVDLQRELLQLFDGQCSTLTPIACEGTPAERAVASHTLKGAALAIGAFRVAEAADAIEARIEGGTGSNTDDLVAALRRAVSDLRAELARLELDE